MPLVVEEMSTGKGHERIFYGSGISYLSSVASNSCPQPYLQVKQKIYDFFKHGQHYWRLDKRRMMLGNTCKQTSKVLEQQTTFKTEGALKQACLVNMNVPSSNCLNPRKFKSVCDSPSPRVSSAF